MTVIGILTRVERHGGELAIGGDGRLVLRKHRNVPQNLVADIRRHKVALRQAVLARTGSRQLELPAFEPPSAPLSFLDRESVRFDALLVEFGIPVDTRKPAKRRVA